MSQELSWTPFDPEAGAADGALSLSAGEGSYPVVALLAGDHEEAGGWAPRAALSLVRGWARDGGRIVLADLGLEAPALHALVGEDNGEGIVDAVLYGASVQRVAGRPSGERFILIPSGTPVADAQRVLAHPRWGTLMAGFQEAGAILALYIPASLPGARELAARCTVRIQLGGADGEGWPGDVDLRLRPVAPLAPEDEPEGLPDAADADPMDAAAHDGSEGPTDAVEFEPPPAAVEEGLPLQDRWDEPLPPAGPDEGLDEEIPGVEETGIPPARALPDRRTPAPVPREVPMVRIPLPPALDEVPAAVSDRGPADVEPSADVEPAVEDTPAFPPHEPIAWEEADPWDLPEFEPLPPGARVDDDGAGSLDGAAAGFAGWPEQGDRAESPESVGGGAEDLHDWVLSGQDVALPIEGGADRSAADDEPHDVPEGDLEVGLADGDPAAAARYEPYEITEDDLPVLPVLDAPEPGDEPRPVPGDVPEGAPAALEEGGADPFGFLGEWGGDREGGDAGEESGSADETPSDESPWGEPSEPWEGGPRSWDGSDEAIRGLDPSPAPGLDPEPRPPAPEWASPLPPEAPAAWSPPAEPVVPEAVVAPAGARGPARRPAAPPRRERATGAWILFLVLLAVAVLLGAARFGLIQIPGVTPPQGDSPLQPGLGATSTAEAASVGEAPSVDEAPAPVDDLLLVVEPTSPAHVLALALTAFGSAVGARAAAEGLQPSLPEYPVMVVPVESGGRIFHRLMVGGAGSYEEVELLRERVSPLYSGSAPSDWIVREADRGFLLAETASRAEAERRVPALRERGIPAYVLEVPLTDGARLWRVHAGAFGSDAEASALGNLLQQAGEGTPPLVPLTGRPPG